MLMLILTLTLTLFPHHSYYLKTLPSSVLFFLSFTVADAVVNPYRTGHSDASSDASSDATTLDNQVTSEIKLNLRSCIAVVSLLSLSIVEFQRWPLCTPISSRKRQKNKKGKGNVSNNVVGYVIRGSILCWITIALVGNVSAVMETGAVSVRAEESEAPQQQGQQGQEQLLSENIDGSRIDRETETTCLPLKSKIALLESEVGLLKVEVSRTHQQFFEHQNDAITNKLTNEILAKCSDGSSLHEQEERRRRHETLAVASPPTSGVDLGEETGSVEGSGSLCATLHRIKMEMQMEVVSEERSLVPGQETKIVARSRRLAACDLKFSDDASLTSSGGWNVLSASCEIGSDISVNTGKTMKVKKHSSVSSEVVLDRQATSSSRGWHFLVSGALEMEGVTLTGGYSVSFIGLILLIFLSNLLF
jgi:hypothetical protein